MPDVWFITEWWEWYLAAGVPFAVFAEQKAKGGLGKTAEFIGRMASWPVPAARAVRRATKT